MLLINSTKNFLPSRVLPIAPVTLTNVTWPCTLQNSSDSVVRRRNITTEPAAANIAAIAVSGTGAIHAAAVGGHNIHSAVAESPTRLTAIASQNHAMCRTITGLAFAKRRSNSYFFGSVSGRTICTDRK